ncbi:MAG TPA: Na-translocating system protein MpsB [Leptospiraceae bacterium]|nr:Na-translocating system protein MpsB [Leptospiraceae bacterium]HMW04058.1 Na-translocating system protein MpsB [Leptospiraceae bacterium]HMX30948.1 Na-translocating system protein MpsB [Leptospiraceae bacterium]HMY30052.1 Na-translocating system protein MpsB [Leptospiraceae bacterium]HMZ62761.1 Na-translocating system protein MpsB [Leptospiraceae bacterium]
MNALSTNPNNQKLNTDSIYQLLKKVPPLWDLDSYIAVNPFLGYSNQPFVKTMEKLESILSMNLIPEKDLLDGKEIKHENVGEFDMNYANLSQLIGPFLASYIDDSISYWKNPWKEKSLWQAFQSWSAIDPVWNLTFANFPVLKDLPDAAIQAIQKLGEENSSIQVESLEKLLFILPGWASYFRKNNWFKELEPNSDLVGLLAILAYIYTYRPELFTVNFKLKHLDNSEKFQNRFDYLKKKEIEYRTKLLQDLKKNYPIPEEKKSDTLPKTKFLFCIDVRSESMRRHLESTSPSIETEGFAGFFGMPIGWKHWTEEEFSHSPALISPAYVFCSNEKSFSLRKNKLQTKSWIQKIKRTFPIGFQYVETAGFLSFFGLIYKTLKIGPLHENPREISSEEIKFALSSLPQTDKTNIAAGILNHLGLKDNFPSYFIITGHGSLTVNNPHQAGLACGACSGQSGELSAIFASQLLNDLETRKQLMQMGISLPAETKFIPAMHETVTDEIIFLEKENIDKSYLQKISELIKKASLENRKEKARIMGLNSESPYVRSKDWAEVFPEAGLAGCASFIIANRSRSKNANLEGRSFLNSYNWKKDSEFKTLELLMTAPAVVASWINLQYYASTTNPDVYGAGNKLLHNVTGNKGVFEGNHWNLKSGLPLQSVFDGKRFVHIPIRLQIIIEAPQEEIDKILNKHSSIGDLVKNEWVYLIQWDENGDFYLKNQTWEKIKI